MPACHLRLHTLSSNSLSGCQHLPVSLPGLIQGVIVALTGERTTLGLAAGVLVLLLSAVDASVFVRVTMAVAGSGGVLIWRARRLRAQAQSSIKSYPIALED